MQLFDPSMPLVMGDSRPLMGNGPSKYPHVDWKYHAARHLWLVLRAPFVLFCWAVSACSLTGCGMGTSAAPDPVPLTVNGRVHGGQQPVVGAQIQLYVAGNAGNGSASSPLLNTTVTSGTDGSFSITGDYSCPSATRAGIPRRHAGQSRTGLRRQQSGAGDDGSAGKLRQSLADTVHLD